MKTMFRLCCTLFMCALFSTALFAQDIPGKELVGTWLHSFDFQGENITVSFKFVEKDAKVTTALTMGDQTFESTPLRANENGKYYADIEMQGYGVLFSFKPNGEALDCEMDIGSDVFPWSMEREK